MKSKSFIVCINLAAHRINQSLSLFEIIDFDDGIFIKLKK